MKPSSLAFERDGGMPGDFLQTVTKTVMDKHFWPRSA
jgi:hypothetical protein